MDSESRGVNIILLVILLLILFVMCAAVPGKSKKHQVVHKTSLKAQTKGIAIKNHADSDPKKEQVQNTEAIEHVATVGKAESKTMDKEGSKNSFDIIAMNNPLYKTHKKGIVQFTHKTHIEKYKISCGRCHHDENGKPLELAIGDPVQNCIECHKGTEKPKGEKLPKKDKIMKYHFEAVHANCIDCHKKFNIDNGDPKGKKPAPVSCGKCHPKTK